MEREPVGSEGMKAPGVRRNGVRVALGSQTEVNKLVIQPLWHAANTSLHACPRVAYRQGS